MKKAKDITIRSSAAEYLTFVAATGTGQTSVEMRYEDENVWLTQKMMATLYDVGVAAGGIENRDAPVAAGGYRNVVVPRPRPGYGQHRRGNLLRMKVRAPHQNGIRMRYFAGHFVFIPGKEVQPLGGNFIHGSDLKHDNSLTGPKPGKLLKAFFKIFHKAY